MFKFIFLTKFHFCSNRLELADILPKDVESYDNLLPPVVHRDTTDKIAYGKIHAIGIEAHCTTSTLFSTLIFKIENNRLQLIAY